MDKEQTKVQRTWILEGFAQHNLTLAQPPSKEEALELLRLIGIRYGMPRSKETRPLYDSVPDHLAFNATRYLRDFEFDPLSVKPAELEGAKGELILGGLLYYGWWRTEHPSSNGVGVEFGKSLAADPENVWWDMPSACSRQGALYFLGGSSALLLASFLGINRLWRTRPHPHRGSDAASPRS